jgi:type IV pilus assembly protein PilM
MSDEQSIWKREISFGRKKDEGEQPTQDLTDELEAIKAAAVTGVTPQPSTPPPAHTPPKPLPPEPEEDAEQKVPFYKRELSFSRKPKAPKTAKAKKTKEPKPKRVKEPKQSRERDSAAKPFWKRDLSLGKKKAKPALPEEQEKKERGGIKLPQLKLPRLERPARAKRGSAVPKKLVGLKIGASQIAAARVANNGNAELLQVAREELDSGIVVGGELREPELLADVLRDFFKTHGLPRRGVRLGIANNRIGVRALEIVGIDDPKQLENAIRFRAQEALPIPIEEAVLDFQLLSESTNEEGQSVKRVLLVVAYRELVDRYVTACRKAGIELVGIDLEAFALLRAMAAPRESELPGDAALVVVAVGHERSTFAVSDGRVCEFTRVLEWGGSALNVALARQLDLAPSEAEPIKKLLDLDSIVPPPGVPPEKLEAVKDAVRRQIQSFARELVSSLQFYQNQPGSLGIGEIVLTGGTAHLPGLAEELQRLIGVTVRVGDPLARVRVGKKVDAEGQMGSLAIAIGLGIED